ncbi:MAG: peroxiredoxin family protein [Planctomycetes bacterium]|nr:peroxiredoxin family protein [Planctomycetota bacterium]
MRRLAIPFLIGLSAGCNSAPDPAPPITVLDKTWGEGWEERQEYSKASPCGPHDPYGLPAPCGPQTPCGPIEGRIAYYKEHVRTKDEEGNLLPLKDQVEFQDVSSNEPTGEAPPGEGELTFVDSNGQARSLAEFRGRPVILVFTRGFPGYICPLCTTYTAQIAAAYPELKALGVEVLLVFPGDRTKVDPFVKACRAILEEEGQGSLPFPVLLDPDLAAVDQFHLRADLSRPATYIIDGSGLVRYAYVGKLPHERPAVERLQAELSRIIGGAE